MYDIDRIEFLIKIFDIHCSTDVASFISQLGPGGPRPKQARARAFRNHFNGEIERWLYNTKT